MTQQNQVERETAELRKEKTKTTGCRANNTKGTENGINGRGKA